MGYFKKKNLSSAITGEYNFKYGPFKDIVWSVLWKLEIKRNEKGGMAQSADVGSLTNRKRDQLGKEESAKKNVSIEQSERVEEFRWSERKKATKITSQWT